MFRRREARCCFLLAFVVVVLVSTFAFSTDYLEPHFGDLSLPKVNIPHWLKPGYHGEVTSEDEVQYPDAMTPSAPEASSTAVVGTSSSGSSTSSGHGGLKETRLAQRPHAPGYTVLDNLYLRNRTFFALTSEEAAFPPTADIMGRRPLGDEKRGTSAAAVIDQVDLHFVDPATSLLGANAIMISGLSVVVLDPPSQAPNTYYTWMAEVVLGSWRSSANASALLDQQRNGEICESIPSRFILANAEPGNWDASVKLNGPIMRGGLPNTAIETMEYWDDLCALDSTIVFERVVLVSRETARARHHNSSAVDNPQSTNTADNGSLNLPEAPWEPARSTMVRNLLGYLPSPAVLPIRNETALDEENRDTKQISSISSMEGHNGMPIVSLFSRNATQHRQGSRPSAGLSNYVLAAEAHRSLVDALHQLENGGICEVQVIDVERASVRAQIELAARSTIIIGAHGEALTNQIWMPSSLHSVVIDLMRPQVFLPEHHLLAKSIKHKYWAVWNDTLVNGDEAFENTREMDNQDCDKVPLQVDAQVVVNFIKAHLGINVPESSNVLVNSENEIGDKHGQEDKSTSELASPPDLEVDILG